MSKLKTFMVSNQGHGGFANGYVILPEGHTYNGVCYDEIGVLVHGGWTFSEPGSWATNESFGNHVIGKSIKIKNTDWVIGFDTKHFGDNQENRDRAFVEKELENVLSQF